MRSALRLRSAADFARVRQEGRLYRHPLLSIAVRSNTFCRNRYGFIVSRALGGAVARNLTKRRRRALIARLHLEARQGFDIVVIARPRLIGQPFDAWQRILTGLLEEARILDGARFA
jgi:ribonuclease P protein component